MIDIKQIIFNSCMYLIGFIFLFTCFSFFTRLRHVMSFLVGMALWGIISTFCLIMSIPVRISTVLLIFTGLIVTILLFAQKDFTKFKKVDILKESTIFAKYFLFFILANILVSYLNYAHMSWDSWQMVGAGEVIAKSGYFPPPHKLIDWKILLQSRLVFMPVLYAGGYLFGADFYYTAFPLSGIYFLLTFLQLIYICLEPFRISEKLRLSLGICGVLIIATVPAFWYHLYYLHTNLHTTIYFTICILGIFIYRRKRERQWLVIAAICLGVTPLLRTEMSFFAAIPIAMLMSIHDLKRKDYGLFLIIFLLISYSWQIYKIYRLGTGIICHDWGLAQTAVHLAYLISYFGVHFEVTRKNFTPYTANILISILLVFIIFPLQYFHQGILNSISDLLKIVSVSQFSARRMFGWGMIWQTIAIFMVIDVFFIKKESLRFFIKILLIFFSFRIGLYSVGLIPQGSQFNSGSRILLHILPIGICYILCLAGDILSRAFPILDNNSSESDERQL